MFKVFKKIGLVVAQGAVGVGRGVIGGPLTTVAGIALPLLQLSQAQNIRVPQNKLEWANAISTAIISGLLLAAEDPKSKKGEKDGQQN